MKIKGHMYTKLSQVDNDMQYGNGMLWGITRGHELMLGKWKLPEEMMRHGNILLCWYISLPVKTSLQQSCVLLAFLAHNFPFLHYKLCVLFGMSVIWVCRQKYEAGQGLRVQILSMLLWGPYSLLQRELLRDRSSGNSASEVTLGNINTFHASAHLSTGCPSNNCISLMCQALLDPGLHG